MFQAEPERYVAKKNAILQNSISASAIFFVLSEHIC